MSSAVAIAHAPAADAIPPAAECFRALGAAPAEVDELVEYARNAFAGALGDEPLVLPLDDEPFVECWQRYADEAAVVGAVPALRRRLVQLSFPIAAGVSATAAYRDATRRGVVPGNDLGGLRFTDPAGVRVFVHATAAGRIPVITAAARADFESLLRALTRQNEPVEIPQALGACIIGNYNNWDRVAAMRRAWADANPHDGSDAAWASAFATLKEDRARYQDRFLLLSAGPYSATPAAAMGLSEGVWLATSAVIRLEHECAHYFTRRVLGSMRNALHDELIADYAGIVAACGRFRARWFLHFMGLEAYPYYRAGGRLENYRGQPTPLSDGAFGVLRALVYRAALGLERFDAGCDGDSRDPVERATRLCAIAGVPLHELAAPDAPARLGASLRNVRAHLVDRTAER
jgi:hypothetical protein